MTTMASSNKTEHCRQQQRTTYLFSNVTCITDLTRDVTSLNVCEQGPFAVEIPLTHVLKPEWTKGSPRGVDVKENIDMRSEVTHFDTTMWAGLGQKPLWRWVGKNGWGG